MQKIKSCMKTPCILMSLILGFAFLFYESESAGKEYFGHMGTDLLRQVVDDKMVKSCETRCPVDQNIVECHKGCMLLYYPEDGSSPGQNGVNNNDKTNPASNNENTNYSQPEVNANQACLQQLNNLKDVCVAQTNDAKNSCDESKNSRMREAQGVISALSQQQTGGVQAACSGMGMVANSAGAAVAAYQLSCQNSIGSCRSSCDSATQFYQQNNGCKSGSSESSSTSADILQNLKDVKQICVALVGKVQQAQQTVANLAGILQQTANCADAANGTGVSIPELCKANPSLPGCSNLSTLNCKDPSMSSNKVCVCSSNPNNPICLNLNSISKVAPGAAVNPGDVNSSGTAQKNAADFSNMKDMFGLPGIEQGMIKQTAGDPAIDGKQGASANLGGGSAGGSGAGASSGGTKPGAVRDPVNVNAGFYSSGAGGGFSAGRTGGPGIVQNYNGNIQGRPPEITNPNLRNFLPGGSMDPNQARGLAGAVGPVGVDGITGPNTNIWQKIQNRYNVLRDSLMP